MRIPFLPSFFLTAKPNAENKNNVHNVSISDNLNFIILYKKLWLYGKMQWLWENLPPILDSLQPSQFCNEYKMIRTNSVWPERFETNFNLMIPQMQTFPKIAF